MHYITHIKLQKNGRQHEHITEVAWRNATTGATGSSTTAAMVDFIQQGNVVYVRDPQAPSRDVLVLVVKGTPAYLRTYADEKWTNNLLSLPTF